MALQIRRGLEADRSSITPLQGELLYVTDTKNIYVGDGSTAGGTLVTGDVADDTTPQLGGNLDLNGNNITGTGNINIDGTITATGNINLGDASGDVINVAGSIATNLNPAFDSTIDLGTSSLRWRNGYFAGLSVDGQVDAVSFNGDLIADDSTVVFDASAGTLRAESLSGTFTGNTLGVHTGDVKGSVFGDDSTLIIDAVNNTVVASLTGDVTGNVTGNLTGNVTGDVTGDVTGNITGYHTGDMTGSVFADDSTVVVDAIGRTITADFVNTNTIAPKDPAAGVTVATPDDVSRMVFERSSDSAIGNTTPVGRLVFSQQVGSSPAVTITSISVTNDQISFIPQPGGSPDYNNYMKLYKTGTVAISRAGELANAPGDAKLEVGGAVLYEPMTTTVRNALTAEVGMVIFNTTDTKLQVCTDAVGPTWVDLH